MRGAGEEKTQTMCAHVNKWIKNLKKNLGPFYITSKNVKVGVASKGNILGSPKVKSRITM
jgi:hypothetical protein